MQMSVIVYQTYPSDKPRSERLTSFDNGLFMASVEVDTYQSFRYWGEMRHI